jgi:hypothetical protein
LPAQANGPIELNASMSGRANLRAASAPAFERPVDGSVQVADAGFGVDRRNNDAVMTRRWRYIIFPARSGRLVIPPLLATLLTSAGERQLLRCEAQTIDATASAPPATAGPATPPQPVTTRDQHLWPWVAGGAGLLLLLILVLPRVREEWRRRAEVRAILGGGLTVPPGEESEFAYRLRELVGRIRDGLHAWLVARGLDAGLLLAEASDRGDAVRALSSLLEGVERGRIAFVPREVRRRVRDVVETCYGTPRMTQLREQPFHITGEKP